MNFQNVHVHYNNSPPPPPPPSHFLFAWQLIELLLAWGSSVRISISLCSALVLHDDDDDNDGLANVFWIHVRSISIRFIGYEGKFCEERYNACDALVCHNGGTCLTAHDGRAHCSCAQGFVGLHCEEELTGCDSSPCVHGICVDQAHGYRCFCQPGPHYSSSSIYLWPIMCSKGQ